MFDFKVTPDGGEQISFSAGARDVLVWEKTTKGATFGSIADGLKMVDLYKIAHIAARRQGLFNGDLREFEETCELDFEEAAEPDPTRPAR